MRIPHAARRLLGAALAATALPIAASAQKVVVSHDEWLTQAGFFDADEQQFVANALSWFGLGGSGNVLLYSANPFLTNAGFQSWLTGLGYTVTVSTSPASFAGYSAVFSEGLPTIDGVGLAAYAQGGGNVFYVGGTGIGGAAAEAAYSNSFLNLVGLGFAPAYNGLGTQTTAAFASQGPYGPTLFGGVSSVFANNGNDIAAVAAAGWNTQVFENAAGHGVFAAAEFTGSTVPEPATVLLVAVGLACLIPARRLTLRA